MIPGSPEKGFTYDEHAVTASVSVMDNGEGTLLFNVTYTGDTVFRNVYQAPVYPVTVSDDGSGTGSASPVSGTAGTNVTLTATPKPGYRFKESQVISGGVSIEGDKFTLGSENAEIKAIFEWIPVYTATINGDSVWTKDSGAALTVTAKRGEADDTCFSHFIGVEIDGTALASGDYEAKAGSTVVTLKASVLQELSDGDHTVTVKFDDGAGSAEFTVKAAAVEDPVSPDTGDGIGPALCFALMGVFLLGFGVTFYCRKRKTDR